MDEAKRELVQSWPVKAHHDLLSARKLAAGPDPLLDTAIYHCQQAAEKAIKGFLVYRDRRVTKTHDVRALQGAAVRLDAAFRQVREAADRVTDYATACRYLTSQIEPHRVCD